MAASTASTASTASPASPASPASLAQRLRRFAGPAAGLLLFAAALWALQHTLAGFHYRDAVAYMRGMPVARVLGAFGLALAAYAVLTLSDTLGLRYAGRPLPYHKTALASFLACVFAHNVGLLSLGGGVLRFRFYGAWGLSTIECARVVAFVGVGFWLGLCTLGGVLFLHEPVAIPSLLGLPLRDVRPLGALLLLLSAAYLVASVIRKKPITIREWEFPLPPLPLSLGQIAVSAIDWTLTAGALFWLLPPAAGVPFGAFLCAFVLATLAGVVSHVPGGLGVFESVMLWFLASSMSAPQALGALVLFRVAYYLLPLALGALLLGAWEAAERRAALKKAAEAVGPWLPILVPHVFAFAVFAGGALLVLSGATPPVSARLAWLQDLVTLPVIEASHFLASLVGFGLLVLAWGLQRRLDAAYHLAVASIATGIVLSLLKGFDWEEALALAVVLAALIPCRSAFHRKASLLHQPFTPGSLAAIAVVLGGSAWLGLFAYRHAEANTEMWWQFALDRDAPRAARAAVGVLGAAVIVAFARLLRPARPAPPLPDAAALDRAAGVVRASPESSAALALLGDKALLFDEPGTAFLMYGVEGRSWVALGDPVGPEEARGDLAWRFRELCDRAGAWPVFYQVRAQNLPLYVDLGLSLLKVGEEARVPLATFALEGKSRKTLRQAARKIEDQGFEFEVVPADGATALMPMLRQVSDAWLGEKKVREKGFSIGCFHEGYLARFPVAVVRKDGVPWAFANVWEGGGKEELSVDLMRYRPGAPSGMMDFLFAKLMLWGKAQGFRWFSLGMAPLSGLEDRALAPLWNRVGSLVYRHAEHFYNFQGVRRYKDKFDPDWTPRYLASPGGLALPRILANIAALISGGLRGVFAR